MDISALSAADPTPINDDPKNIFKKVPIEDMKVVEFKTALKYKQQEYHSSITLFMK